MTISATERRELRGLALTVFGERGADLLMAGLAGSDLEAMEERLNLRIELSRAESKTELAALRGEFGELRAEIGTQNRLFFVAVVTMVLGIVGLLVTAYQLGTA